MMSYRWKGKKADGAVDDIPIDGKITIEEFYINVPLLKFKITSKMELINKIGATQNIV